MWFGRAGNLQAGRRLKLRSLAAAAAGVLELHPYSLKETRGL